MSCSKDNTIQYMIKKGYIKKNLDVMKSKSIESIKGYIEWLTKLAKSKYNVDKGPLFKISDKQYTSNRGIAGSNIRYKKVLTPNEEAFDAIDKSYQQVQHQNDIYVESQSRKEVEKGTFDNYNREKEGNYTINEEGDVIVPPKLTKIKINC
jgi:hypothetical protein